MNNSFHPPEQKRAIFSSLISPDVYLFYQLKKIQKTKETELKMLVFVMDLIRQY